MGCGGSKEQAGRSSHARKYLAAPGGHFGHAADEGYSGLGIYTSPTGPLTAKEYKERLVTSEGTQSVHLPRSGYTLRYAYVSQRGLYPDSPDKPNQDSFCVHTAFNGDPEQHLFGVFDGHGDCGTQSSQFARDKVPLNLLASAHFATNPALAFHQAMVTTNLQCHRSDFDDSMSGTTAIALLLRGRSLLVANVGDSRAVLGERMPAGPGGGPGGFIARDLSIDQTPYRRDEAERVKAAGARVLTLDQIEGLKDPTVETWTTEEDDDGDPPRLWFPNGMYPGTAFTRSIGDAAAERIGVFAEPELEFRYLAPNDAFIVIASDGVFEFISSQRVVDMVSKFDDPHEACLSVVAESYRQWLQYETRTDDITMILLQLAGLDAPPTPAGSLGSRLPSALPSPVSVSQHQQQQQQQQQQAQGGLQQQQQAQGAAVWVTHGPGLGGAGGMAGVGPHPHQAPGMLFPLRGNLCEDIEAMSAQPSLLPGELEAALPAASDGSLSLLEPQQQQQAQAQQPGGAGAAGGISPLQLAMLEEAVKANFLFAHLGEEERLRVFAAMKRLTVQPGEVIIRQGEEGEHFYIVEAGVFDVMLATGEPPPLQQQQQQEEEPLQQLKQQQQQQQAQQWERSPPARAGHQRAPSGGSLSAAGSAAGAVLLDNDLMADIAASAADEALTSAFERDEAAGSSGGGSAGAQQQQQQQQQVQPAGPGSAAASEAPGSHTGLLGGVQTPWGELVHTYEAAPLEGPGGGSGGPHPSFGELALLYGKPRAATVVAQSGGVLWQLGRGAFRAAVQAGRGEPGLLLVRALRGCELLECLTLGQLLLLAGLLKPRLYEDGDVIGHQGEPADEFCIVAQGAVAAVVRKDGSAAAAAAGAADAAGAAGAAPEAGREVLTFGPGALFGERALSEDVGPRPATMVARGQVLLLCTSHAAFEATFGPLAALQAQSAAWRAWLSQQQDIVGRTVALGPRFGDLLAGRFDPQALALRGCLWLLNDCVSLACLEDPAGVALTARLFDVAGIEARGLGGAVARARRITASLPPCLLVPHTVAAWHSPGPTPASGPRDGDASSSSSSSSGRPLPAVAGEALATVGSCTLGVLLQEGPLDERAAAYVAGCALLGLAHLHRLGLVYRGLSAITLLVTELGLIQLVDFRFASRPQGRCYTLCGVPEYLAPEVVAGTGHDESADWWSLGVLVYHLVTGSTPFARLGDDELRIYRRILRGGLSWPDTPAGHDISANARDLVAQLLQRDPARRLGMAAGVAKLQAHPWFSSINWADLQEGRTTVPLGLRERLFRAAAAGGLACAPTALSAAGGGQQAPPPGAAGGKQASPAPGPELRPGVPAWLDEF